MRRAILVALLLLAACGTAAPTATPPFARLTARAVVDEFRRIGLAATDPPALLDPRSPVALGSLYNAAPLGDCTVAVVLQPDPAPTAFSPRVWAFVVNCPTIEGLIAMWNFETKRQQNNGSRWRSLRNANLILTFWDRTAEGADVASYNAAFIGLR